MKEKLRFFQVLYQEFFSADFSMKNRHFSLFFFASYFALKIVIFSMIALEHAAAPSEKPFAAAFWRAAFFMKMSKTIVAKIHIFSVFCPDFRFLAARVPEPGIFRSRGW